jgi:hypothetical protein
VQLTPRTLAGHKLPTFHFQGIDINARFRKYRKFDSVATEVAMPDDTYHPDTDDVTNNSSVNVEADAYRATVGAFALVVPKRHQFLGGGEGEEGEERG